MVPPRSPCRFQKIWLCPRPPLGRAFPSTSASSRLNRRPAWLPVHACARRRRRPRSPKSPCGRADDGMRRYLAIAALAMGLLGLAPGALVAEESSVIELAAPRAAARGESVEL